MLTVPQLLDAARTGAPIQSDYRLARVLGVSDTALYNYRHGGRVPTDEVIFELAKMAKLPPAFVLTCMSAERAKDPAIRAAYLAAAMALAPRKTDILPPSSGGVEIVEMPMPIGQNGQKPRNSPEFAAYTLQQVSPPGAVALAFLGGIISRRNRLKNPVVSGPVTS